MIIKQIWIRYERYKAGTGEKDRNLGIHPANTIRVTANSKTLLDDKHHITPNSVYHDVSKSADICSSLVNKKRESDAW